ncbi:MAG TPA: helix-turn-helix transcriptional regulator [Dermatophilaceae bacterium]|nr:helix-turn-helix transcriptional regulator [Dermatophilaceae bacterium]
MILIRRELGDVLRERRQSQGRTLREVSANAAVSLGYLSEIERGEKEASSELLGAICAALGLPVSRMLHDVSDRVAQLEGPTVSVVPPVPQVPAVAPVSSVAQLGERNRQVSAA